MHTANAQAPVAAASIRLEVVLGSGMGGRQRGASFATNVSRSIVEYIVVGGQPATTADWLRALDAGSR